MKRLFARNTLIASQERGNLFAAQLATRQFASSPQKNPYSSIMTKLAAGNSQFSYYKLPALQDKRIGKYKILHSAKIHLATVKMTYLLLCVYRYLALFDPHPVGIRDQKLR
jgi:hypothetical protein